MAILRHNVVEQRIQDLEKFIKEVMQDCLNGMFYVGDSLATR